MYDRHCEGALATATLINEDVENRWRLVDEVVAANSERMVNAFRTSGLASLDLMGSTGYGYQDRGRELLDQVVARVFGCSRALIRAQWASGTHAIATALKALAKPGRRIWLAGGWPYDTIRPTFRALENKGVTIAMLAGGEGVNHLSDCELNRGDLLYIQRSRGYSNRPSWGQEQIEPLISWAHSRGGQVMVDNCYGEFTQTTEPGHWGADLVVGSLMKNPGGSIAPTGAYVAGTDPMIEAVADELFAPGIGAEVGATGPYLRLFAQGFFLAPQLVGEALKGGLYISQAAEQQGIVSDPPAHEVSRNDIVVALELGTPERVITFCQVLQSWQPVDGFVRPEPWDMPGYDHPVIMAAGGFVAGGSLELSADAPIRPPYRVYVQGGINHWHTKLAIDDALQALAL